MQFEFVFFAEFPNYPHLMTLPPDGVVVIKQNYTFDVIYLLVLHSKIFKLARN